MCVAPCIVQQLYAYREKTDENVGRRWTVSEGGGSGGNPLSQLYGMLSQLNGGRIGESTLILIFNYVFLLYEIRCTYANTD